MGRLIFTKEAGNNENKFIVGTTVGRQSKFVRSTLKRRASNNSQGLCCDSAPTKVEPLPESDVASIEIEDINVIDAKITNKPNKLPPNKYLILIMANIIIIQERT